MSLEALMQAREALVYHQEQTRPIQRTIDAITALDAALSSAPAETADTSKVICPKCCHQFRAIPDDVQRLMLDAGFEPPFDSSVKAA
jgi:hypothetical protein